MEKQNREAARLEKNRYMREYRKRNPEKMREISERYWFKKAQQAEETKAEGSR